MSESVQDLSFDQRLFGALKDIADLVAKDGDITTEMLWAILEDWTTDDFQAPENPYGIGLDTAKLIEGIQRSADLSERAIDAHLASLEEQFKQTLRAIEERGQMDQLDFMAHDLEHQIEDNQTAIAYITAYINDDNSAAHEIIDEQGCTLVHTLSQWFVNALVADPIEFDPSKPRESLQAYVNELAMALAHQAAMTKEERRTMLETVLNRLNGQPYDQDDEE